MRLAECWLQKKVHAEVRIHLYIVDINVRLLLECPESALIGVNDQLHVPPLSRQMHTVKRQSRKVVGKSPHELKCYSVIQQAVARAKCIVN